MSHPHLDPASVRNPSLSLSLDPDAAKLPQLIDNVVILAFEAQKAFIERFGGLPQWGVDLDAQLLWLEGEQGRAEFVPFFLGTAAEGSDTWMWGWNNINGFSASVVGIANDVLAFGEHFAEQALTVAQQPLDAANRVAQGLPALQPDVSLVRVCVLAAQALSGIAAPVWYVAEAAPGSDAWFLLSNPAQFALPPATVLPTLAALTDALEVGAITHGAAALAGYASRREGVALIEEGPNLVLRLTDGDILVTLDDRGRITRMNGTAGASAPQPPAESRPGLLRRMFGR